MLLCLPCGNARFSAKRRFMNLYEKYFLINLKDYPALGIDLEINKILLFVAIGAMLAFIFVGYIRAGVATALKALLRREAIDEDSARTLDELRINTLSVRLALRNLGGKTASVIARVGDKKYTYEEYMELSKKKGFKEEKTDLSTARFYIKEGKRDAAKAIYDRFDSPVLHTVLACVLLVALYSCMFFCMPGILNLVNSIFS